MSWEKFDAARGKGLHANSGRAPVGHSKDPMNLIGHRKRAAREEAEHWRMTKDAGKKGIDVSGHSVMKETVPSAYNNSRGRR
jgi:hypothetical protein